MSSPRGVKEIKVEEDGTKVVIQGVYKESDRTQSLVEPSIQHCNVKEECHPLCRFDQIHNIKHTGMVKHSFITRGSSRTKSSQRPYAMLKAPVPLIMEVKKH
jgi:hypothetical protein